MEQFQTVVHSIQRSLPHPVHRPPVARRSGGDNPSASQRGMSRIDFVVGILIPVVIIVAVGAGQLEQRGWAESWWGGAGKVLGLLALGGLTLALLGTLLLGAGALWAKFRNSPDE